tara:strand:+ start:158 stop:583 length:426 start_codon:yes stop_codon:yes gene_type:complete
MPLETITIEENLNVSLQPGVGDIIYYIRNVNNQGGTNHPNPGGNNTKPIAIGEVMSYFYPPNDLWANRPSNKNYITIQTDGYPQFNMQDIIGEDYFLFFSKDRRANTSGVIGYYAETEFRNYTKKQAEIFATAVDYVVSSK